MDETELSSAFARERQYLVRVAYSTLGSLAEAEDVVQEAWLRLQRASEHEEIRDLRAWLTRVVGRLALDALRSARNVRETYVGEWLPEPVVEPWSDEVADRVALADAVSTALLVVLERLSPPERTAFVLHDVFGLPFEEVATVVGRSAPAVRQLASRARRHVHDAQPRYDTSLAEQRRLVAAFARACVEGDLEALTATLDADVVWRSDGGGKISAARKPIAGRTRVAKAMLALASRRPRAATLARVGGAPGIVLRDHQDNLNVISFTISAGRIVAVDMMRNPDKLRRVTVL